MNLWMMNNNRQITHSSPLERRLSYRSIANLIRVKLQYHTGSTRVPCWKYSSIMLEVLQYFQGNTVIWTSTSLGHEAMIRHFIKDSLHCHQSKKESLIIGEIDLCYYSVFASFGNISPSMYRRVISFLPLVRMVMDFLKCPGNFPAPL